MKVGEFFMKYEITISDSNGKTETIGITPKIIMEAGDDFYKCKEAVFNNIKNFVQSKIDSNINFTVEKAKEELEKQSPNITEKYEVEIVEEKPQVKKEVKEVKDVKEPNKTESKPQVKSIFEDF